METAALIIGIIAVVVFLASYTQRKRSNIVLYNLTSRVLYVVQYLLLGALEGAVLDICGAVGAFFAQRGEGSFIKRHWKLFFVMINVATIGFGVLLYKNVFSILPIVGILFQANALWLKKEKHIRIVSMIGCPFWFTYNFVSGAYGSCIGDILSFVILGVALVRYDIMKKELKK